MTRLDPVRPVGMLLEDSPRLGRGPGLLRVQPRGRANPLSRNRTTRVCEGVYPRAHPAHHGVRRCASRLSLENAACGVPRRCAMGLHLAQAVMSDSSHATEFSLSWRRLGNGIDLCRAMTCAALDTRPICDFGALHRECTELTCLLQKLFEHNRMAGALTDTQSVSCVGTHSQVFTVPPSLAAGLPSP